MPLLEAVEPLAPARPLRLAGLGRLLWALARTGQAMGTLGLGAPRDATLSVWSRHLLASLRIRVEVEGPLPSGAVLWTANHLSWIDPLVLLSLRPMGVLAKREVADYPFLGPAAARAGLCFVEREDPLSRAAALVGVVRELRRGRPFLIFPEGTTTRGHHLARVHEGGLLAAHRLGLPTLPIRLDCEAPHYPWIGDESLLPHLRKLAAEAPLTVQLRPGPVLDPGTLQDPYEWLARVRGHLAPRQSTFLESPI